METLLHMYRDLFPYTTKEEWFYALLGMLLYIGVKLKNVPFKNFRWKLFWAEFIPVWYFSSLTIIICLGTLPNLLQDFGSLDAALIGYSSSSLFKQLLKSRITSKLGIK